MTVGAIATAVRIPLLADRNPPNLAIGLDAQDYLNVADHLERGQLFFNTLVPRGSGYPMFIALLDLLPFSRELGIVLVQHALGVGLVVAVFLAAWSLFGRVTAVGAGTLAAFSPLLLINEDEVIPDFLFGSVVFASALILAYYVRGELRRPGWLVALGVAFGVAALVKPVGQVLPLAALLTFAFADRKPGPVLRQTGIVAAAFLIVVGPWIVHGLIRYGSPEISQQGGLTLFNRVFEVDGRPIPADTDHGRFARAVVRRHAADPDARPHALVLEALVRERGLSGVAAIGVERELALRAIRRYPVTYAWNTAAGTAAFVTDLRGRTDTTRIPGDATALFELRTNHVPNGPAKALTAVARALSEAWWVLTLGGLLALAGVVAGSRQDRDVAAALLSIWIVVAVATAAGHGPLPRYSSGLAPITWMLSIYGATIAYGSLWRWSRRRLERPAGRPFRSGAPAGPRRR